MADLNPPNTQFGFMRDPIHQAMSTVWQRLRDNYNGERAVKNMGTAYLPMLTGQTQVEYDAYLARAYLHNMLRRTLLSVVGLVTRKNARVSPPVVADKIDNMVVDNRGNTLMTFVAKVVSEATLMGRVLVLVDYEDDQPLLLMYRTEDIWRVERNRKGVITRVELHEEVVRPLMNEHYARVLTLNDDGAYTHQVWDLGNGQTTGTLVSETQPKQKGRTLDHIPVYLFEMDREGESNSLLEPLSDLNMAHYRQVADYKHLLHFCCIPTLLLTGVPDIVDSNGTTTAPSVKVGAENAIILSDPSASGKWLNAGSEAANPVRLELQDLEGRMSDVAVSVAVSAVSRETATSASSRSAANTASVVALIREVNRVMTGALQEFVNWEWGDTDDVGFSAPVEFTTNPLEPQLILALLAALNEGKISIETFLDNLARGELLGDDSVDEELERLTGVDNDGDEDTDTTEEESTETNDSDSGTTVSSMIDNNID